MPVSVINIRRNLITPVVIGCAGTGTTASQVFNKVYEVNGSPGIMQLGLLNVVGSFSTLQFNVEWTADYASPNWEVVGTWQPLTGGVGFFPISESGFYRLNCVDFTDGTSVDVSATVGLPAGSVTGGGGSGDVTLVGSTITLPVSFTQPVAVDLNDGAGNPIGSTTGALNVFQTNAVSSTVNQGNQGTAAEGWFVELTDGVNVLGVAAHPLYVQGTVAFSNTTIAVTNTGIFAVQDAAAEASLASIDTKLTNPLPISGTVAVSNFPSSFSVTQGTSPWVTSFSSPQHVIVDSGAVTVSGTVGITGTVSVTQGTSPWVVSLTSTTITGNVSVVGTDADNAVNSITKLPVIPARANAAAPSWTEGHEVPLSTDLSGNVRVVVPGSVAVTGTFWPYSLGQQTDANSVPSVLPADQITALTPPTAAAIAAAIVANPPTVGVTGTVAVTQTTNPWVVSNVPGLDMLTQIRDDLDQIDDRLLGGAYGVQMQVGNASVGGQYVTGFPGASAYSYITGGNVNTFHAINSGSAVLGTALNSATTILNNNGAPAVMVQLTTGPAAFSTGQVTFEISYDGVTWSTTINGQILDPTNPIPTAALQQYNLVASTTKQWLVMMNGAQSLRIRTSTAITPSGTIVPYVAVNYSILSYLPYTQVYANPSSNGLVTAPKAQSQTGGGTPSGFAIQVGGQDQRENNGLSTNYFSPSVMAGGGLGVVPFNSSYLLAFGWSSSTSVNTVVNLANGLGASGDIGAPGILVNVDANSGSFSAGALTFEISYDSTTTWVAAPQVLDPNTLVPITVPYSFVTSTNKAFLILTQGAAQIRARLSTAITGSGTVNVYQSWVNTIVPNLDAAGAINVNNESRKKTYSAYATFTAVAGVIAVIPGNATTTVRITRVEVSLSTSGTAAIENISLIKTSAAPSGGTPVNMTTVPHDSNFAAASSTAQNYTSAPSAGTPVGTIRGVQFADSSNSALPGANTWLWDWGMRPASAVVLRGSSQTLEVNLGAAVTTQTATVSYEWTEE